MGVDARCYLPVETGIKDIILVIGMLCGHETKSREGIWKEHPDEISLDLEDSGRIRLETKVLPNPNDHPYTAIDHWHSDHFFMTFDNEVMPRRSSWVYLSPSTRKGYDDGKVLGPNTRPSYRYLAARSHPFNIALFQRLAQTFGGYVDYCDFDDGHDFEVLCPIDMAAEDGPAYFAKNHRMYLTEPMTEQFIRNCCAFAAYDELEDEDFLPKPLPPTDLVTEIAEKCKLIREVARG